MKHNKENGNNKAKWSDRTNTDGIKRKNKHQRQRYSYARCQKIFKDCSRKLADVVINNDLTYLESTRQPLRGRKVKRLYDDLWRRLGPLNTQVPVSGTSESLLHEIFPAITAEYISGNLKKIRNKTATGPAGLHKKNTY